MVQNTLGWCGVQNHGSLKMSTSQSPELMNLLPHGREGFTHEIKLKALIWGTYPRLSGWVQCGHSGPQTGRQKKISREMWPHRQAGGLLCRWLSRKKAPEEKEYMESIEAVRGKRTTCLLNPSESSAIPGQHLHFQPSGHMLDLRNTQI